MNLFVDMDGVLADFAQHHQAVFGWRPDTEDNVDWAAVREVKDFYLNIPPMADLQLLWARIERYQPIVLTGVPEEIGEAPANKRAWVSKHLGPKVQVLRKIHLAPKGTMTHALCFLKRNAFFGRRSNEQGQIRRRRPLRGWPGRKVCRRSNQRQSIGG